MNLFGTKKVEIKPTLLERAGKVLEESKEIKSVFVKMADDLNDKNEQLKSMSDELDLVAQQLIEQSNQLHSEIKSNKSVITNIDKIISGK